MKVIFLKDHMKWKKGEISEIPDDMATYMLRCRTVTIESESDEAIQKKLSDKLKKSKKK